jgi:nicotinate-nucleotide adenylyltransferase
MVREKIQAGENWRYLVPAGARYLIEDRLLYGFAEYKNDVKSLEGEADEDTTSLMETIVRVENYARVTLSPSRFLHSRSTALMAWDLCRRFGLNAQKGYLAGIAHDICKRMSEKDLMRYAYADGAGSTKLEKEKPGLLHGRAAAVFVKRKYGVTDPDVLEAIRCHTTASQGMGQLAKAVYVADKVEVSRQVDDTVREALRNADLDTLFRVVFDSTVAHLVSRDVHLSHSTKRLLAAMQKKNNL